MLAFYVGRKVNSKGDIKQKLPIPRANQKVSAKKEEQLASRAHKSQKITTEHLLPFKASVNNAEDKPKGHISYADIKFIDTTRNKI